MWILQTGSVKSALFHGGHPRFVTTSVSNVKYGHISPAGPELWPKCCSRTWYHNDQHLIALSDEIFCEILSKSASEILSWLHFSLIGHNGLDHACPTSTLSLSEWICQKLPQGVPKISWDWWIRDPATAIAGVEAHECLKKTINGCFYRQCSPPS